MTDLKKYRRGTKNYYRLLQVPHRDLDYKQHHQCVGCCFNDLTNRELPSCVERKKEMLACQDYTPPSTDESGEYVDAKFIDYIFVPATKQGLADYMKHRLEYA